MFKHSGDLGDIIYALPTIKALGGGDLYLSITKLVRDPINQQKINLLKPLLEAQDYITNVDLYYHQYIKYDLDQFRFFLGKTSSLYNIADCHARVFGCNKTINTIKWLNVDKKFISKVIMHRSIRYQNGQFNWQHIVNTYKNNITFIGLEDEYISFCQQIKNAANFTQYYKVKDFLEMAEIINAASLFVGNQSFPYSIAEGLKKDSIQETYKDVPNVIFTRNNAQFVLNDEMTLPNLNDSP